ncbi:hypothetical protein H072_5104 [Dactylellina haptotyla CBS 200.50]|uniref:Thioredoxin reductase n=1 Tax=Dactylellina haptotyla (strain CBS 200.50) TaxID=1284197 RepID=S8BNE0_DACHA|nr:hypothetical protein H072_5104 [Dactylellina haptotyla CBS 200.50]
MVTKEILGRDVTSKDVVLIAATWPEPTEWMEEIRKTHPGIQVSYFLINLDATEVYLMKGSHVPDELFKDVTIFVTMQYLPPPEAAPKLEICAILSAGINHVSDSELYKNTDIMITTSNGVHGPQIAEWVVGHVLAHTHRFRVLEQWQKEHRWGNNMGSFNGNPERDLVKQKIGIFSYGSIGRQIGRVSHALGMEVHAYTATPKPTPESREDHGYIVPGTGDQKGEFPVKWYSGLGKEKFHEFLQVGFDVIVLSVPLTDETLHLVGKEEFDIMKETGTKPFFVNISRGPIVVTSELEKSLREGVEKGGLRGAALDVVDPEPLPKDHTLWDAPNVPLRSHKHPSPPPSRARIIIPALLPLNRFLYPSPSTFLPHHHHHQPSDTSPIYATCFPSASSSILATTLSRRFFFRPSFAAARFRPIVGVSAGVATLLIHKHEQLPSRRSFNTSSQTALPSASPVPGFSSSQTLTEKLTRSNMSRHDKVVIIGSGPAAHTAAIYLARAELSPILYEGFMANGTAAGGQLTTTTDVENFPGFPSGIMGPELMDKMREQSIRFGTEIVTETVAKVDLSERPFKYWLEYSEEEPPRTADAIILATGASAKRLNLPGEEKYWQSGISACAVCDGAVPIFRKKPLAVIGGGDSAAEEALFLTKYGSKVYVLVRKDKLRASNIMAKRLSSHPKVEILYNTIATETKGDGDLLTSLTIEDTITGKSRDLQVNGLFYAIGHEPATSLVKTQMDVDAEGYVKTVPGTTETSVKGVFAAGDVQDKRYRQAITSAGSGCMAALECERLLAEEESHQDEAPIMVEVKKESNGVAPESKTTPLV